VVQLHALWDIFTNAGWWKNRWIKETDDGYGNSGVRVTDTRNKGFRVEG
jgi:hypothetical protein